MRGLETGAGSLRRQVHRVGVSRVSSNDGSKANSQCVHARDVTIRGITKLLATDYSRLRAIGDRCRAVERCGAGAGRAASRPMGAARAGSAPSRARELSAMAADAARGAATGAAELPNTSESAAGITQAGDC